MNVPWWGYVILAGLSWGTYVPIIFYGGSELGGKANARLLAILCVGAAYFVIGVRRLLPEPQRASGHLPRPHTVKRDESQRVTVTSRTAPVPLNGSVA